MKLVILVALGLVAVVLAEKEPTKTIRSDYVKNDEGSYNFGFETDDGTVREEVGTIKEVLNEDNKPQKVVVVRGSYTYTDTEGKPETISYSADEFGYHAEGDSIPKPVEP